MGPPKTSIDWSLPKNKKLLAACSTKEVAQALDVTIETVYSARKRTGIVSPIDESRRWTKKDKAVLRANIDADSAVLLNRSLEAVLAARKRFQIPPQVPPPERIEWSKYDHLFGTDVDREISLLVGCSHSAVRSRRQRLGIAAYVQKSNSNAIDWSGWTDLLGQMTDKDLAHLMQCGPASVSTKRKALSIAEYKRPIDYRGIIELAGILSDREIATIFDVGNSLVSRLRRISGKDTAHINQMNRQKHLLGTMTDRKLATILQVNIKTVMRWREQEGITPYRFHDHKQ